MIKQNEDDKWFRFDNDKNWRITTDDVFKGTDDDSDTLKGMTRDGTTLVH